MSNDPTLKDFLTRQEQLSAENGSHGYIHWRQVFAEHLVNRHRAVDKDLTPLRIYEHEARLQHHLDTEPMTGAETEAVHQLRDALVAGDENWQQIVLDHLGLHLDPEKGITNFRRSVLVHVFQLGRPPAKEPWYKPFGDPLVDLIAEGYVDDSGAQLKLTGDGLAAAEVLWPRVRYNDEDGCYAVGSETYGVLIGPMREGRQAVVKLLEVAHC